jgi:anti-sigma factor RsiW
MIGLSCRRAARLLAEGVSGGLEAAGQRRLDAHLAACAACRAQADAALGALHALFDDSPPDPGEAYWSAFPGRVRHRIERESERATAGRHPAWWAAAVVAVSVLFVVVFRGGPQRGRVAPAPADMPVGADTAAGTTASPSDESPTGLESVFGEGDVLDGSVGIEDLSIEERRELLRSLQAELDAPA